MSTEGDNGAAADTVEKEAATGAQQGAEAGKAAAATEGAAKPEGTAAAAEPVVEPTWRDDWREAIAAKLPEADREKELTRLRRFQSPENLYRSQREIERKMSAGQLKPVLGEAPTETEVKDYRKAHGIPDEPTAEGYGLAWPQGYEPNDADKADLGELLTAAHKAHVPPATAQLFWNQYLAVRDKAEQQLYDAAVNKTIEQKAELKAEWGRDFDSNAKLGNAHLVQAVGEDQAKTFMALTLADGTKLGDNPAFLRYIVGQARATADEGSLVASEFDQGGKSLEEQLKEAINLKHQPGKWNEYHSDAHQKKIDQLSERIAARAQRAA